MPRRLDIKSAGLQPLRRLFSFRGRAGREEFWDVAVGSLIVGLILLALAQVADLSPTAPLVIVPVLLLLIYLMVAVTIRRLHDRGKTGCWILFFVLLPYVLSALATVVETHDSADGRPAMTGAVATLLRFWAWIELGFLPAHDRGARYGEDSAKDRRVSLFG